jgi:hypothetical protein
VVELVIEFPEAFPEIAADDRRALLHRFGVTIRPSLLRSPWIRTAGPSCGRVGSMWPLTVSTPTWRGVDEAMTSGRTEQVGLIHDVRDARLSWLVARASPTTRS